LRVTQARSRQGHCLRLIRVVTDQTFMDLSRFRMAKLFVGTGHPHERIRHDCAILLVGVDHGLVLSYRTVEIAVHHFHLPCGLHHRLGRVGLIGDQKRGRRDERDDRDRRFPSG